MCRCFFFLFRQKTAYEMRISDWSSDVCSSDLAEKTGLTYASEVFADRTYADDGNLTSRSKPNAMVHDPAEALERVLRMVEDQEVVSTGGKRIRCRVDSICVHGDGDTAVELATAVRRGIEAAGVSVVTLPEMPLGRAQSNVQYPLMSRRRILHCSKRCVHSAAASSARTTLMQLRHVANIAHVAQGNTHLADRLLRQSGPFRP